MNYAIRLAYDGTRYNGWQRQGNTDRTIQGKLEAVLAELAGGPVEVQGSGRTDRGVHAEGQTANFRLPADRDPGTVMEYLNRYLPEDIQVLSCARAPEAFHSRLSAVRKTYRYQIEMGPRRNVFQRNYYYGLGCGLDLERMRAGAGHLIGTHDFKSFCGNPRMKKSCVRTIEAIDFAGPKGAAAGCGLTGTQLFILYRGNGFLQQMVRILTGTLIEVGLGKREPESLEAVLRARDRQAAGFTAPAQGLFLVNVEYGEEYDGIFSEALCKEL